MSLLDLYRVALDFAMILCGLAIMLSSLIVLVSTKPFEVSVKTVAAFLLGAWGATKIAVGLQPHEAFGIYEVIGPIAVTLWISQAIFRHHENGMHLRRFGDWIRLEGLKTSFHKGPPHE